MKRSLPPFIREHGYASFGEIYLKHKEEFEQYAKQFPIDASRIEDVYQDAFIIFYENICSGKLYKLTSKVKTYIFSVGKFMILNEMKKNKKEVKQEYDKEIPDLASDALEDIVLSEKQEAILSHIQKLGKSCQKVLIYFYYHQLSIKEIQAEMNYNSVNVTKSKKSQCLKVLKNSIRKNAI